MSETILSIDAIVSNPKIRGGRPVIAGTGIGVSDLVAYHIGDDHMTAEELAESFNLDIGLIHAALAYYYLHQEEVEAEMQGRVEKAERLMKSLEQQGKLKRFE